MSAPPRQRLSLTIPGGDRPEGMGADHHDRAPLPFAHIPGQTPRHPEGAFDTLRATARAGMSEGALAASPAFRAGLHWLHTGCCWEAHEVLEAVWMACPPNSPARQLAQALIQIANARLKDRMGRPRAATRLRLIAARHLSEAQQGRCGVILGLDPALVAVWLRQE